MPEPTEKASNNCPNCGQSGLILSRSNEGSLVTINYFCENCHESWVSEEKIKMRLRRTPKRRG